MVFVNLIYSAGYYILIDSDQQRKWLFGLLYAYIWELPVVGNGGNCLNLYQRQI